MRHREEEQVASRIVWSSACLFCIAEVTSHREGAVARKIHRNVKFLQLRRYDSGIVTMQGVRPTSCIQHMESPYCIFSSSMPTDLKVQGKA